jgi:biotin synthase
MNNIPRPETNEIIRMLSLTDTVDIENLYKQAYEVKKQNVGTTVYFRGIVEISNICTKDCYYCGIRKSNHNVERFKLDEEEVITSALWAYEQHYGSVVLQSGERDDEEFVCYIENIVKELKSRSDGRLGITLSLGEQTEETYRRWYAAGAHRYLLRIETSSPELYKKLHPANHDWQKRWDCLRTMKKLGYQTGTGVMIGLPHQTLEDLARDVQFFYDEDIDMIGMGPFIPHADTPFANALPEYDGDKQLELALKDDCRLPHPAAGYQHRLHHRFAGTETRRQGTWSAGRR